MQKEFAVYAIGSALVDIEFVVDDKFLQNNNIKKGVMSIVDNNTLDELINKLNTEADFVKKSCGGSACNSIVAMSNFGVKTFYTGKVANDEFGKFFLQDLKNKNISFKAKILDKGITGKCLVMITKDAQRTMNTFLGINENLCLDDLDINSLNNSKWLYVEGYLATDNNRVKVGVEAMNIAKKAEVKTSINLSDPFVAKTFTQQMKEMIGTGVDLIFCNIDEALSFSNKKNIKDASNELKKYTKTFAITLGSKGCLIYDGKTEFIIPAIKVKAIDTNGAGDMFAGAFLYAINNSFNYYDAAKFANTAAAIVVSKFGPRIDKNQYIQIKKECNI